MPADQSDGGSSRRGTSGGSAPRSPWSLSIWERLSQTFLKPPAPKSEVVQSEVDVTRLSDEEKRARIVTIDPLERKIGLAAAAFAAVLAVAVNVPYMVSKISVPIQGITPKNGHCPAGFIFVKHGNTCNGYYPPSHYVLPLVVALVLALAIYVTVRIGRRAPLAFATAITGIALQSPILLIPFVLAAGWLILRSFRMQKYGSPTAKAPLPGWVPPPRSSGRTRSTRTSTGTKPRSGGTSSQSAPRSSVSANKRYTPKAPPKKRPAPPAAAKPSSRQARSKSGPASKSDTEDT